MKDKNQTISSPEPVKNLKMHDSSPSPPPPTKELKNEQKKKKKPFMHIALNAEMKNGELSHFTYQIKEKRSARSADPRKREFIKRNLTESAASLTRKAKELVDGTKTGREWAPDEIPARTKRGVSEDSLIEGIKLNRIDEETNPSIKVAVTAGKKTPSGAGWCKVIKTTEINIGRIQRSSD